MLSNTSNLTLSQAVERITFCERNIEEINTFFKVLEQEGDNFSLNLTVNKSTIVEKDEFYELNYLLSKMVVFELDKVATSLEDALYGLTKNTEVTKYNFNYIGEDETLKSAMENHIESLTERELLERLHFARHMSFVLGSTYGLVLRKGGLVVEKAPEKKGLFGALSKMLKKEEENSLNEDIGLIGCSRTEWKGYSIFEAVTIAIEKYQESIIKRVHDIGYTV